MRKNIATSRSNKKLDQIKIESFEIVKNIRNINYELKTTRSNENSLDVLQIVSRINVNKSINFDRIIRRLHHESKKSLSNAKNIERKRKFRR